MNRIGIIVDGAGDFASLKARLAAPYLILKTDGPRSHTATPDAIAKGTRKQILMLRAAQCARAIVLVDSEARHIPYSTFLNELRAAFGRLTFGIPVIACACNIMIENWYLADICALSRSKAYLRLQKSQKHFEGKHGKNELKKRMSSGHSYLETKHGPDLFRSLDFVTAATFSPSFADFLQHI